jgi:predicted nucleic acid-binding protein
MRARVIVDTSVWIDFFRGKLAASQKEALIVLIEAEEVAITDVIKHELLIGARTRKDFLFLQDSLSALEEISLEPDLKPVFNRFGFDLKMQGLVGKYTDLSIAFLAQKHGLQIYSLDRYFSDTLIP